MNDELQHQLAQLAGRLGTTADHLWQVTVRQAWIGATNYFLVLALIAWVGCFFLRKFKNPPAPKDDYENDYENNMNWRFVYLVFAAICALAIFLLLPDLSENLAGYFNPEYWALRNILEAIHGD